MSKFIDKLKKLREVEPQPMGFMLSQKTVEKPKLQLVGLSEPASLESMSDAVKTADAVIIEVSKADEAAAVDRYCQDQNGAVCGVRIKSNSGAVIKKLLSADWD